MRSLLLVAVLAGCAAAPPASPPPPSCGSSCATPAAACARLRALGCAEGEHPLCEDRVVAIVGARLTRFDPACVVRAAGVEEVRRCPAIECP